MEQPDIQDSEVAHATEEPSEVAEHEEISVEDPETESPHEGEEEEEIDYEGQKYKVPKNLRDAFLRQADYTRKTQEVAEQRKQLEAQAAQVQRQAKEHQEYVTELAEVVAVDKQLAQFQNVNWQQLYDANPGEAARLTHQMNELRNYRGQLAQSITQKQQQRALNEQQATAKQVQEASLYLAREVKGWSDERSNALLKYGVEQGIPADVLSRTTIQHPAIGKILHKAELYDQLVKKQSAKPRQEAQEKPVTRITSSKSGTHRDPEKMSADEWLKWRNAQIKRR
jgi:hypothetical protein